jgi:hypothetical protein
MLAAIGLIPEMSDAAVSEAVPEKSVSGGGAVPEISSGGNGGAVPEVSVDDEYVEFPPHCEERS